MNKKDAKKKGVGYSAEDRKSMKVLIERTQPDAGDYVGSGTVTKVPKKVKRMSDGGEVAVGSAKMHHSGRKGGNAVKHDRGEMREGMMARRDEMMKRIEERRAMRGKMREERREEMMKRRESRPAIAPEQRDAMRAQMMQKMQGIGNRVRERISGAIPKIGAGPQMTQPGFPVPAPKPAMRGGGLARKGVGMALAKGGLAKANGCVMRGKTRGKMV